MHNISVAEALSASFRALSKVVGLSEPVEIADDCTVSELGNLAALSNLNLDQILAAAALHMAKARLDLPARSKRDGITFLTSDLRPSAELAYQPVVQVRVRFPDFVEVSTGIVRKLCSWRWASGSIESGKRICGWRIRSWPPRRGIHFMSD